METSLKETQKLYYKYLQRQNLSQNTVTTCISDAFYLYRKDQTIDFFKLVTSSNFEEIAPNHLHLALSKNSTGNIKSNINGYMSHLRKLRNFLITDTNSTSILSPSPYLVEKYLQKWNTLESYDLQEKALNKLFFNLVPNNTDISDILIKASTLNDFYSTNIFTIFPVAKHIFSLNIDERLLCGDESLVEDLKEVVINGKKKHFYSFASKYCSHHNPNDFPIYDSYVDKVLRYFRDVDKFSTFKNSDLKNYIKFKNIIIDFQNFYNLQFYSLKELDKFLWQFGKEYFPKDYK